ncbi:MAG: ankyrin repeat domain-containing protein [Planctomycetota bacterium]
MNDDELFDACENGDAPSLKQLLQQNPGAIHMRTDDGDQPLHLACWQKAIGCVSLLLDAGADVNSTGDNGKTPLHYALLEGDENSNEIVRLLLESGANAKMREGIAGKTPLDLAIEENHEVLEEAVLLLREAM